MTAQPTTIGTERDEFLLTSTVLAVILRVAGPVTTRVRAHAIGLPERLVVATIGDALLHLTDVRVAARIRQHWDAAQYLVAHRLPERVSQTWLAPTPGTYPVAVSAQPTWPVAVSTRYLPAQHANGVPAHVRIRVDRLIFQVCDQQAWRAIGDALFDIQRHLS